jgi:hypothetical protein
MIQGFLGEEKFEIKARLEGDQLLGRVGGALMPKDLALALSDKGVSGRVGGKNGFSVLLELEGGELIGLIGSERVVLRGVDQVTGALGSGVTALEFAARQRGEQLQGRIGGLMGKSFELDLDGAPGWIGVLIGLVTYYALERHSVAKGSAAKGTV